MNDETPFLTSEPPPFAARGLAWLLLALFCAGAVAVFAVRVPETVKSPFVLAPIGGADPVRAPLGGTVIDVDAAEGRAVSKGGRLFAIRSAPFGERASEAKTLEARVRGEKESLENARKKYESETLAAEEERKRLLARSEYLDHLLVLKREQIGLTEAQAARARQLHEQGLASLNERADAQIRHSQSVMELEDIQSSRREVDTALGKLAHESEARRDEFKETERGHGEREEAARIRIATLRGEVAGASGDVLPVLAPCDGTILRVAPRAAGAVVKDAELLAEIACAGGRLQAEMTVPQDGLARLKAGQPVRLLYAAFPYQRYGVKNAVVTWVSPGGVGDGTSFRALATLAEDCVTVSGQKRPLLAGMSGTARVVVGRRSLASYAIEPLRALRESAR
jgi:membrane fusion protein